MSYEEFRKYVENDCMHEATYIDSEGREILVICMLDAYTTMLRMAEKHVKEEREACAQILDHNADACRNNSMLEDVLRSNAAAIRARSKE